MEMGVLEENIWNVDIWNGCLCDNHFERKHLKWVFGCKSFGMETILYIWNKTKKIRMGCVVKMGSEMVKNSCQFSSLFYYKVHIWTGLKWSLGYLSQTAIQHFNFWMNKMDQNVFRFLWKIHKKNVKILKYCKCLKIIKVWFKL